jgi:hypothetical protein
MIDLTPTALYAGALAFVVGMWGAIFGLRLSDTVKYSRKTERIVYLIIGLAGGAAACTAWLIAWISRH